MSELALNFLYVGAINKWVTRDFVRKGYGYV